MCKRKCKKTFFYFSAPVRLRRSRSGTRSQKNWKLGSGAGAAAENFENPGAAAESEPKNPGSRTTLLESRLIRFLIKNGLYYIGYIWPYFPEAIKGARIWNLLTVCSLGCKEICANENPNNGWRGGTQISIKQKRLLPFVYNAYHQIVTHQIVTLCDFFLANATKQKTLLNSSG